MALPAEIVALSSSETRMRRAALLARMAELVARVEVLEAENAALKACVGRLEVENAALKAENTALRAEMEKPSKDAQQFQHAAIARAKGKRRDEGEAEGQGPCGGASTASPSPDDAARCVRGSLPPLPGGGDGHEPGSAPGL